MRNWKYGVRVWEGGWLCEWVNPLKNTDFFFRCPACCLLCFGAIHLTVSPSLFTDLEAVYIPLPASRCHIVIAADSPGSLRAPLPLLLVPLSPELVIVCFVFCAFWLSRFLLWSAILSGLFLPCCWAMLSLQVCISHVVKPGSAFDLQGLISWVHVGLYCYYVCGTLCTFWEFFDLVILSLSCQTSWLFAFGSNFDVWYCRLKIILCSNYLTLV